MAAEDKNRGAVEGVGKRSGGEDLKGVQERIGKEEQLPRQVQEQKPKIDAQTLQQFSQHLPRLIQMRLQKIDTAQIYQTFTLAGTDYLVHDRRMASKEPASREESRAKGIAEESKMNLEAFLIQKGKKTPVQEKDYENYLVGPVQKTKLPEQKAAEERWLKLLTRFEKMLLQRFEKGELLEQAAPEGRSNFLKKTADQWRAFFAHFTKRTVKRRAAVEMVESWIYRGLVQKNTKMTVISDLNFAGGVVEKFARWRISKAASMLTEKLLRLEVGSILGREDLKEQAFEMMEYLAIKPSEADTAWAQAPLTGKFLQTAQAEEKVAADLGIQLESQAREKEKMLRRMGGGPKGKKRLWGGTEEEQENPVFVPWWSWNRLEKKRGPLRWFVAVSYLGLAGLVAAFLLYLISRF